MKASTLVPSQVLTRIGFADLIGGSRRCVGWRHIWLAESARAPVPTYVVNGIHRLPPWRITNAFGRKIAFRQDNRPSEEGAEVNPVTRARTQAGRLCWRIPCITSNTQHNRKRLPAQSAGFQRFADI
ncbi:hypothetical protein KCP70_13045 [Salmonella enterica subsp. enterica]|nr:hypothetical protein KCP70_13045 [Salmonella enterica subsp. enterica]